MHWKRNARPLADDLHQPVDGIRRERHAALAGEDVTAIRIFLAKGGKHAWLTGASFAGPAANPFDAHG